MKQTTRKMFLDALERLIEGKPDNRELKLKAKVGKLKINCRMVEKEAELAVGALRNHEDIKLLLRSHQQNAS